MKLWVNLLHPKEGMNQVRKDAEFRKHMIQLRKVAKGNPRTTISLQASRGPSPGWGRQRALRGKPLGKTKRQFIQGIWRGGKQHI